MPNNSYDFVATDMTLAESRIRNIYFLSRKINFHYVFEDFPCKMLTQGT